MNALVTGITGFIGSHVAERLLGQGDRLIGVARNPWHVDAPSELVDAVDLLSWNISEPAEPKLIAQLRDFAPDVIFHFAGLSIPSQCGQGQPSEQAMAVNVTGTLNILELARALPRPPRIVFASTCHVYDRVNQATALVTEQQALQPISAYGATKLLCEQAIRRERTQSNLDVCVVRGFHHIGPRQPSGLMLTDWFEQLSPSCHDIHVRSTNSYLDLVDVRDAAKAYELLAKTPRLVPLCNLGSGRISRSGDVLDCLLQQIPQRIRVIAKSDKEQWNPIANISVLQSLGWGAEIPYERTISDMMSCRTVT